jgi:hypothetical protein
MALTIPNLDQINKKDPKTAEALTKVQSYVNLNVNPVAGNRVVPPAFVNPGRPAG